MKFQGYKNIIDIDSIECTRCLGCPLGAAGVVHVSACDRGIISKIRVSIHINMRINVKI